jgi:hypothetical protein
VALAIGLTVLPDLVQLLPVVYWVLFRATDWSVVLAYINGLPGAEPVFEPALALLTHHLHCVMHSALVAGLVTGVCWMVLGRFWWPLAGWWAHIVIDVFTHSADFYPSPVFYPLTQRGFDGVAWNTPVCHGHQLPGADHDLWRAGVAALEQSIIKKLDIFWR